MAQLRAQIAYLTAQIEVVEIESSDKTEDEARIAIVNALSGLETKVNEQITIVKAEAAAALVTFNTTFAACTVEGAEAEILVAPEAEPSSEEGSEVEPTEEEAQEGEGEEPAEESPSP